MSTTSGQSTDLHHRAVSALRREIDFTKRLPERIFVGAWEGFFFFDPDWIFESKFIEQVKAVLEVEGSACACICDLDAPTAGEQQTSCFFVDRSTFSSAYAAALSGTQAKPGWTYSVGRFACVSDLGTWCIYCERRNEIAVVAVKPGHPGVCERLVSAVKALPIDAAIAQSHIYGLSAKALSADWRRALIANYPVA